MLRLIDVIPVVDNFLLGNANTNKLMKPDVIADDAVINAPVTSIIAEDDFPVIWISVKER